MDDLISRQAAIDALWKAFYEYEYETENQFIESDELEFGDWILHRVFVQNMSDIDRRTILDLPSAQPEPKWIPCSERLPEDDTLTLVNYIDKRPDAGDIWIGWHEMENVWYIDGEAHSKEFGNEVIAWMPLPEPYKEGANNERDEV